MNPFLQWGLVAAQMALAANLLRRRRWLLAGYFLLAAYAAADFHPLEARWWHSAWASREPWIMVYRTVVTEVMILSLPRIAVICGFTAPAAVIFLGVWPEMPRLASAGSIEAVLAEQRVAWLMLLAFWMLMSAVLALLISYRVPGEYWMWMGVMGIYAAGAAISWSIGGREPVATINREWTGATLLLLTGGWAWFLSKGKRQAN